MLPKIAALEFNWEVMEEVPQMGVSFLFDFKKGDFVIRDGKLIQVEGIEAIKGWIEKVLRTEKFRFKIYDQYSEDQYGVAIEDLIVGKEFPQSFVEAELKREVTTALMKNPLIQSISEWRMEKAHPAIKISFKVNLVEGFSFEQEVKF